MNVSTCNCATLPAVAHVSRFTGTDGVDETHLVVRPTEYGDIATQLGWVQGAYQDALESLGTDMRTAVLRRFFCSDLPNQAAALNARPFSNPDKADLACAVSWVEQPPMSPAKVALWAYHISDPGGDLDKALTGSTLTLRRPNLAHHWTTGLACPERDDAHVQTAGIFDKYCDLLRSRGMSLADNAVRTWVFVRDIDADYGDMAAARREYFAQLGLTPDTHYIASSGIGGKSADAKARVAMDAYAISGARPEQIEYIEALDHLPPTHKYGVTFERATSVAYRDRKHVLVSGTASIDQCGEILHAGDPARQLGRTLENIAALLKQAGATLADMCVFIVYVRDPADQILVQREMRARFGDTPIEIVTAPVCRPGWLIEIEGQAILPANRPGLQPF